MGGVKRSPLPRELDRKEGATDGGSRWHSFRGIGPTCKCSVLFNWPRSLNKYERSHLGSYEVISPSGCPAMT